MPSEKRERQRQNAASRAAAARAAQQRSRNRRRGIVAGGAILLIVGIIALLVSQSTGGKKATSTTPATSVPTATTVAVRPPVTFGSTPCPNADGSAPRTTTFAAAPQKCIVDGKTYTATMTTDAGPITIALDPKGAPMTVNNFVFLARYHFFDGLTFHRVIPGFVDQGGDPAGNGSGGPGYKFADELPAAGAYKVGSLAMANSGPNTNGSQFFIIVGPQGASLPPQYSLFGQITQGVDVAHKIEADGTSAGTPKVTHKIVTVTIAET